MGTYNDQELLELQEIKNEINKMWKRVTEEQCSDSQFVNATAAAHMLCLAEETLVESKPNLSQARYRLISASLWLKSATEYAKSNSKYGAIAVAIELSYLVIVILISLLLWLYGIQPNFLIYSEFHIVPFYIFIWGFLGGIAWCLYSATYWTSHHLFDKQHISWYIAHPWMSAILGAAVSLLFSAGLVGLTQSEISPQEGNYVTSATISVVSFVSGYSAKLIWEVLDRQLRKMFGETQGSRVMLKEMDVVVDS